MVEWKTAMLQAIQPSSMLKGKNKKWIKTESLSYDIILNRIVVIILNWWWFLMLVSLAAFLLAIKCS